MTTPTDDDRARIRESTMTEREENRAKCEAVLSVMDALKFQTTRSEINKAKVSGRLNVSIDLEAFMMLGEFAEAARDNRVDEFLDAIAAESPSDGEAS